MKMICKKIAAFRTIWCIMAILLANATVYGEERTEAERQVKIGMTLPLMNYIKNIL